MGLFQLGIRPWFTTLPILFRLFAKLMSLLNLLPRRLVVGLSTGTRS
jgi:hypothetical protein